MPKKALGAERSVLVLTALMEKLRHVCASALMSAATKPCTLKLMSLLDASATPKQIGARVTKTIGAYRWPWAMLSMTEKTGMQAFTT